MNLSIKTVEDYIDNYPKGVQEKLISIRNIIMENAPNASEHILYGMPAYKTFSKPLVYFAAYTNHIGFYATPTGNLQFSKELGNYKVGKGSIQFPMGQHLPLDLITKIVKLRVSENELKYNL
jgi:uncharacterized protein YdhG (YjbR/CyaY superfamily)